MALSTKAELRTSLKNWSKRTDLTDAELDDFITLCEAEFNRVIRIPANETRDSAFAISAAVTALPTGFREFRRIHINELGGYGLQLISPQAAADYYDNDTPAPPKSYLITGSNIQVFPAPDGSYTADIIYFKAFDALTDSVTNAIFTNYPDVYLWGGLLQMMPYIGDDERAPLWASKYQDAIRAIIEEGYRTRWRGSQPQSRVRVTP
jgi:hypothetical protein